METERLINHANTLAHRNGTTVDETLHDLGAAHRFHDRRPGRDPIYVPSAVSHVIHQAVRLAEWRLGHPSAVSQLRGLILDGIAAQIADAVAGVHDMRRAARDHALAVNNGDGWTVTIDHDGTTATFQNVTLPGGEHPVMGPQHLLKQVTDQARDQARDACTHPAEHRHANRWAATCRACAQDVAYQPNGTVTDTEAVQQLTDAGYDRDDITDVMNQLCRIGLDLPQPDTYTLFSPDEMDVIRDQLEEQVRRRPVEWRLDAWTSGGDDDPEADWTRNIARDRIDPGGTTDPAVILATVLHDADPGDYRLRLLDRDGIDVAAAEQTI